jgi:hypothetical protein
MLLICEVNDTGCGGPDSSAPALVDVRICDDWLLEELVTELDEVLFKENGEDIITPLLRHFDGRSAIFVPVPHAQQLGVYHYACLFQLQIVASKIN